jgi:hypothetical protein
MGSIIKINISFEYSLCVLFFFFRMALKPLLPLGNIKNKDSSSILSCKKERDIRAVLIRVLKSGFLLKKNELLSFVFQNFENTINNTVQIIIR